tara:strand:+ start:614 stop:1084 length:471 start_codon:yes stop_codon:yes gene_type:complete
MKYLLVLFSFSFVCNSYAQIFQTGITLGTNYTFPIKGKSVYDNQYFKPIGSFGFGVAVPLHFKINNIWQIKSGTEVHYKTYRMKFSKPDFPELETRGGFKFVASFWNLQLPLILSFKKPKQNFEFGIGDLFTRNSPDALGTKNDWIPLYSGNDTLT